MHGGVVLSLERMNRILEIDEANLLAVVEPNVITGDLQDAVEQRRPVLSARSGVAAAVGHRRQRRRVRRRAARVQVRHDQALRARRSRRCCRPARSSRPAAKVVKNVVGYDLTQLLVGSEGTLAIITKIILRLVPKPPVQATLRATFRDVDAAVAGGDRHHPRAGGAGGARADRRRFARGRRAATSTSARWRRRAPARCCCSKWTASPAAVAEEAARVEQRVPRRRRDRGPARARRGRARRSCGACAASCRCR